MQIAQVYLRHRPIADLNELRSVASGDRAHDGLRRPGACTEHARASSAVRSGDARSAHAALSVGRSPSACRRAIAGILIRADYQQIATPDLAPGAARAPAAIARRPGPDRCPDPAPARLIADSTGIGVLIKTRSRFTCRPDIRLNVQYWRVFLRQAVVHARFSEARPAGRVARRLLAARRARRQEDRLHDHRQFARRTGNVSAASLPSDQFDFVELVERGRPDWLASACRKGVRCDVLARSPATSTAATSSIPIALDARESLPVDEMERVSCSDSCPGVVLAAEGGLPLRLQHAQSPMRCRALPLRSVRSLIRSGHSPADADRLTQVLERTARRKQSRSNAANLQGRAGHLRVLVEGAARPFRCPDPGALLPGRRRRRVSASGRPSAKLLVAVRTGFHDGCNGHRAMRIRKPAYRRDVCHFADDRLSPEQKVGFVHAAARSRHGRSADVPGASREIVTRRR